MVKYIMSVRDDEPKAVEYDRETASYVYKGSRKYSKRDMYSSKKEAVNSVFTELNLKIVAYEDNLSRVQKERKKLLQRFPELAPPSGNVKLFFCRADKT